MSQINSIKIKKDRLQFAIDKEKYELSTDFYSKISPLLGVPLPEETVKKLKLESDYFAILNYVKKLTNKRVLSKKETIYKIGKKFDLAEIPALFKMRLTQEGFLNDDKFVAHYYEYLEENLYGKYFIENFLKIRGVEEKAMESVKFGDADELEKAERYTELIKNRFVSKNFVKQKRKLHEALFKRGYSSEICSKVVSSLKLDREKELSMLKKDYERIKDKYGSSLTISSVVSKLISKGYSYNDIYEVVKGEKDDKGFSSEQ
jgi:1,2-diacylglycerol 3-alpha-glucosyltransferase